MRESSRTEAGLYFHIPFCASICPYCDFAVMKGDEDRRRRFVETLIAESDLHAGYPERFDTVYFGGGTPSLLTASQLREVLEALESKLSIDTKVWIGLEANPEDVNEEALSGWRRLGVGMLSLGVQSFSSQSLALLGRKHDAETARRAVLEAKGAGFETLSIDVIYGLPGQSIEEWRRDLDAAIELEPDHLSCYQLTVHEKTVFGVGRRRGQFSELDPDRQAELFFETHRRLERAGFEGYEASNFATARRHRSRHNVKYWDHTPYLGLGPSAHSFDGRSRWWNERKEVLWARRVQKGERPVAGGETLSVVDRVLERLMLGFRTRDGRLVRTSRHAH